MNRGKADRWLLPDGIEEILPAKARHLEALRRQVVDLFQRWGYDYVIPPMVEFTDSLLTGSGSDIDLLTFKVTDQLSGKMMGIRADITPQAARMDAHSLRRDGINRLCYAGHVMHTRPHTPLASRTPLLLGVELFGEASRDADLEVICLLLETLEATGIDSRYIDLGHVGLYQSLVRAANLSKTDELAYFTLLQGKRVTEAQAWVDANLTDQQLRDWFLALTSLSGGGEMLDKARALFQGAPAGVNEAIDDLAALSTTLLSRYPQTQLYIDFGELRGYHYHTGIVFGASALGHGNAIANGGRYDHIGEVFGRARPATGFNVDLTAISHLSIGESVEGDGIFAAQQPDDPQLWAEVVKLRAQGERVVQGLAGQSRPEAYQKCQRELVKVKGKYCVQVVGA